VYIAGCKWWEEACMVQGDYFWVKLGREQRWDLDEMR
jgi:hypothetical protein